MASPRTLVGRLGPHPATSLGLDLTTGDDRDLARWLVLCMLLGGRTPEPTARAAYRRLEKEGLVDPDALVRGRAGEVHACLEDAGLRKSAGTAAILVRVAENLRSGYQGSVERLASGADDLEDLAQRLSRLGAGFGRAAVFRFLTPLRSRWSACNDLPSTAAVRQAAVDLDIVPETQDEEGTPAGIADWLARHEPGPGDPALLDVEAALDRLGRAACLRGRTERCPLDVECPRRAGD